jgi:hypothetical protein
MKKMNHGRIRFVGLAALAALVIAAVAASSASALPEFGQCVKIASHEGKYTNSVCTAKAKKVNEKFTGEFEWRKATEIEAAKKQFSGTGGRVVLTGIYRLCEPSENVRAQNCRAGEEEASFGPLHLECTSEENQGELSGTKAVKNVHVTFKGCEANGFGGKCQNTATEGEIKLNTLKGKLGFINKSTTPRQVGLAVESAAKKGKIATYHCNASEFSFAIGEGNETEGCVYPQKLCGGDGLISAITPVNTATSVLTQVFTANEETAEQIPTKFAGTSPLKELEGYIFNSGSGFTGMWSKVAESLTNSDKLPEAIEIKAN